MITEFSTIPEGFFGDSGLTATSANHIANLLKLKYESAQAKLRAIGFVTEKLSIIGNDNEHLMRNASTMPSSEIKATLDYIARCKGFIAFLREAIKCKDNLTAEIDNYHRQIDPPPLCPMQKPPMSEADVIAAMTIAERTSYYAAEARAATYGQFIHPNGPLDAARDYAFEAFREPTKVALSGRDTVFVKRALSMDMGEIDAMMLELQAEQRKSEAELNGYKHKIEQQVKESASNNLEEYRVACAEYEKRMEEYRAYTVRVNNEDTKARMDRRKEIEALKIVIPHQYRDLYNEVNG